MSLVIQSGSNQFLVEPGQKIIVDKVNAPAGETIELDLVYAYGEHKDIKKVKAKVIEHFKDAKVRVVKYKSKSNYKRTYGPRQQKALLEILK